MAKTREEIQDMIMQILEDNSTTSLTGDTIIEESSFINIADCICDELGLD